MFQKQIFGFESFECEYISYWETLIYPRRTHSKFQYLFILFVFLLKSYAVVIVVVGFFITNGTDAGLTLKILAFDFPCGGKFN